MRNGEFYVAVVAALNEIGWRSAVVAARPPMRFKHTFGGGAAKARWKWRVPSAPSRRWMVAAGRAASARQMPLTLAAFVRPD
jgi:hypothetical protein